MIPSNTIDFEKQKTIGITEPISLDGPNELETKLDELFEKTLSKISPPESEEDKSKQKRILNELSQIFINWLRNATKKRDGNASNVEHNNAISDSSEFAHTAPLVYTYGSFRLGVHERGADIDTLLIGPNNVTHSMFFEDLCATVLEKHEKVTEFSTAPNAFVPIAKFVYDGVSIDLIYAQTSKMVLDESFDIHDDEVMRAVIPQTIRSLNGVRVTDLLLDLVPNKSVFRKAVRFLKIWAKRRGIYGNSIGYLGGVSYSIMAGRICQLYTKANTAMILKQFFEIYDLWHWPTPVCLTHIRMDGPGDHAVWNREANLYDRMPIITPSYPAQNSTYNVTFSTFAFLREEISRAREILKSGKDDIFEKLIEANTFFKNHKHYFQISGSCFIEEDFTAWFGWIESRIRRFVGTLEEILYFKLVPFPQSFNHDLEKQKNISFFIGSKIIIDKNEIKHNRNNKRKKINIVPAVKAFVKHINDFNSKTEGMSVKVNYISKSKLPDFVFASNGKRKRD